MNSDWQVMQFVLALPENSTELIYRQVYDALRDAILAGRLRPGEKLPSTRELADCSGISRFTVIRGYKLLIAQGYVETIAGSGVFVTTNVLSEKEKVSEKVEPEIVSYEPFKLSLFGERILGTESLEAPDIELFPELNYGAPRPEDLPLNQWRDVLYKSGRFRDKTLFQYVSDPMGYMHLREALSSYLTRARSVRCTHNQVAIFSGAQSAFDLVCRLLIDPNDTVVVENPGSPFPRRTLKMFGAKVVPISIDKHGPVVEELYKLKQKVRLVYITPSHQDPSGVVMSLERRKELLAWAQQSGAIIIEDDYDSEYNYGDRLVPSLQGLDESGSVIYISSFWKVLYPIVHMGFLVLPERLVHSFSHAKAYIERDLPLLEHVALTEFINAGTLEAQIKRMKKRYAKKRAALTHNLTKLFAEHATISGVSAGMHITLQFDDSIPEETLLSCARTAKVPMVSTEHHYITKPRAREFMIDFAHSEEAWLSAAIEHFAELLARTRA